jgi:hypothetical protein
MSRDSYDGYAADCMRLAERESSPEAKAMMLFMAQAWVRLAQQKQAIGLATVAISDEPPGATTSAAPAAAPPPH